MSVCIMHAQIANKQQGSLNEQKDGMAECGPRLRKVKPRNTRRRISEEEWNKRKAVIERLYIQEGKLLSEVMEIMESEYNFKAS